MKTIPVTATKPALGTLLEQAAFEAVVLVTSDGREFILAEVESFDREIELMRQDEELMRLLDVRGQERATVSLAEARARLLDD